MMNHIIGGWNYGMKTFFHTGTPFSVTNSRIAGRLAPSTGGTILAALVSTPSTLTCGPGAVDTPCLSTSNFASTSAQNNFGNLPRNSFRAPGYVDTDVTLYKSFALWSETSQLRIGAQMYNVFNHPNFAPPVANVAAGGFGTLFSTVDAPTSPYGAFQGSAVSGRVIALTGRISF